MKKLLLILFTFSLFSAANVTAQYKINSNILVSQEFKNIYKKFGWTYEKVRKKIMRRNGAFIEHDLMNGKHIIEHKKEHSDFTEHRFYVFSNGRFLDGYQTVTTYQVHYSLIRQAFEDFSVMYDDGPIKKQRIDPMREYNPLVPTRSTYSYYNALDHYYITFGAKHEPDVDKDDIFSIAIYRGTRHN